MSSHIKGLIAAPFTPFKADGSVNLPVIRRQAQRLARDGVVGAFICGTTGEGLSLTAEERMRVAERWVAEAGDMRMIVHVGHQSVAESRRLAAHAARIGAAAVASIGPTFFGVGNAAQLADYCAQIAAAAPQLPFFYYHIPSLTRLDLPMRDFLEAAARRIPNFAGIKFTHENLMDYHRCLEFRQGRFDILFGRDEMLLPALSLGAAGAVGSTYNFMAALFNRLLAAFHSGDLPTARRLQAEAIAVIAVMSRYGGLPSAKAMMNLVGIDCGPVRAPLQNLSRAGVKSLAQELRALGFPHA